MGAGRQTRHLSGTRWLHRTRPRMRATPRPKMKSTSSATQNRNSSTPRTRRHYVDTSARTAAARGCAYSPDRPLVRNRRVARERTNKEACAVDFLAQYHTAGGHRRALSALLVGAVATFTIGIARL